MFERDYLMRMIEQAAQALARILTRKKSGTAEEVLEEISVSGRSLVGFEPDVALMLPDEELQRLATVSGTVDWPRLAFLARLLCEQAEIHAAAAKPELALPRWRKGLAIFAGVLAHNSGPDLLRAHGEALARAAASLVHEALGPRDALLLARYFEATGELGRAEDQLYPWIEADEADARAHARGFYERLLAKSDAELERGNLPRDEVEEGLARLS